jgi:hypothetical protein
MPTGATGQLGLALPVQGELSGTWGNTVNNAITEYTNLAIAATLTLTNDGAVTLANTTGNDLATNITSTLTGAGTVTAQHAVVRVTGTLTTTKVITAPSYSKTYVVINDATGGSVTIRAGAGTGVTIAVGDKALVAYNGTDYVRVGASAGGSDTQVQFNSGGNLAGSANMTFNGTTLTAAAFSGPLNGTVGATTPSTVVATQVNVTAQGDVRFEDSSGGQYVGLQAPGTVTTSVLYTLPGVDGSAGQLMTTDGSGNLSFTTVSSPSAASGAILINNTTIGVNYTIAAGTNGFSVGPITISSGFAITVSSGQRWVVL